jgi:hypothetical protein
MVPPFQILNVQMCESDITYWLPHRNMVFELCINMQVSYYVSVHFCHMKELEAGEGK